MNCELVEAMNGELVDEANCELDCQEDYKRIGELIPYKTTHLFHEIGITKSSEWLFALGIY